MPVLSIHFYGTSSNDDEDEIDVSYIESQTYKKGKPSGYSPLRHDVFKNIIAKTVEKDKIDLCYGFIKHRVIYVEWQPMDKVVIFAIPSGMKKITVNDEEVKYHHPALLFRVSNGSVDVFALDGSEISEKSQLYHAPFPNVYDTGDICMGTYDLNPDSTMDEMINEVDYWFFESQFNAWHHDNYNKEEVIKAHEKEEWKKEELVKHKKTIRDLIN